MFLGFFSWNVDYSYWLNGQFLTTILFDEYSKYILIVPIAIAIPVYLLIVVYNNRHIIVLNMLVVRLTMELRKTSLVAKWNSTCWFFSHSNLGNVKKGTTVQMFKCIVLFWISLLSFYVREINVYSQIERYPRPTYIYVDIY